MTTIKIEDDFASYQEPRVPERLYHYTSIESLAMILSTRKLLFKRLDLVNDPEEADTTDFPNAKTLVFVSCWTGEGEESLPHWKIYTQPKRGVRVSLPANLLDVKVSQETHDHNNYLQILKRPLEVSRSKGNGYVTAYASGPFAVEYTKNEGEHLINCIKKIGETKIYLLDTLGTKKKIHWSFEKEWRYKVLASFSQVHCDPQGNDGVVTDVESLLLLKNNEVTTEFLLVDINNEALQQIEIMIGPSPDPSTEIIVNALLSKHDINATITRSKIKYNW